MTLTEQAAEALAVAGERVARAEHLVRAAVPGFNSAIDTAHASGIGPDALHGMASARARLGALGQAYLDQEIRAWDLTAGPGRAPGADPREFADLHRWPRPPAPAAASREHAAEAVAAAAEQLALAESGFESALGALDDAIDFAQHAGIPAAAAHRMVNARADLGGIGARYLDAETGTWDAAAGDWAEMRAGPGAPAAFWDLDLLAHAAKGTGSYLAAAAIWQAASGLLPAGHEMGPYLHRVIANLRIAASTGQSVTVNGNLFPRTARVFPAPGPQPAAGPQPAEAPATLAAAVREHAAGHADEPGWRVIAECWTDREITDAISGAASLAEAVDALSPFADACAGRGLAGLAFPAPPGPAQPAARAGSLAPAAAARRPTEQARRTP